MPVKLRYHKTGPPPNTGRPPVVFLHGAGGSSRLFGNQFQAFRDLTACYFPDLPGHGESLHPIGVPSIALYAEAVADFINHLPAPAVLVGHSMGGAVALELALTNPGLVQGLVLAGTGCRLPVTGKILEGLETDYAATFDTIVRYCFSKSVDPDLLAHARAEIRKTDPEIVRADFHACHAFDCCGRVGEITLPTLIICGSKDMMTPLSFSQQLHSSIRDSTMEIVPGGSHMLMLEQPETFNRYLSCRFNP